jgi:predicted transcriptional regulator
MIAASIILPHTPEVSAQEQRKVIHEILGILRIDTAAPIEIECMCNISAQCRRNIMGKLAKAGATRAYTSDFTKKKRYALTRGFQQGKVTEDMLLGLV